MTSIELRLQGPTAERSVRDHGLGIPPDKRERIFDRYYQAHGSGHSGTGLGLYVSRKIVERHGGKIGAEFPANGGSRFVVRLPLQTARRAQSAPRPRAAGAAQ